MIIIIIKIIIIITFIYTAKIQLYSFQMLLTIKDLKIYLTTKKRKTIVCDKIIPGHMDKDNKNLSYFRVFKH